MNVSTLKRILSPVNRRIKLLFTRGLVRLIDPSAAMQLLQVELYKGETLDDVEHIEPYGVTAHPHPGAECVAVSKDGRRSHTFVITVGDRRYRLTGLTQGEVALYDDQGQTVHLRRDGVYVTSANQLVVDAPQALFTGDVGVEGQMYVAGDIDTDSNVNVAGNVEADGDVTAGSISLQQHVHGGSPTAPTGPVSPTGQPQ